MLSIKSAKPIVLHAGDASLTYNFLADACSSDTANDGTIPYGRTVSSVSVSVTDDNGDAVADLVDSSSVADNTVSITMSYPGDGDGTYKVVCVMTLDNGSKLEWMVYVFCETH